MEDRSSGSNVIAAVILSVIVLFAWDYFFAPKTNVNLDQQVTQQSAVPNNTGNSGASISSQEGPQVDNPTVVAGNITGFKKLSDVLSSQENRLPINTKAVSGSIDLKTGRFDDLMLKRYDKELGSDKNIRLLAPGSTEEGFFAEIDYTLAGNQQVEKPLWTVMSGDLAAAGRTVILQRTIGNLEITRNITIDDNYLFQVSDKLKNIGQSDLSITPYGLIKENDPPFKEKSDSFVVHTGFVGYINDSLLELTFDDIKDDKLYKDASIEESTGGWIGITEKYWTATLIPDSKEPLSIRAVYNPYAGQDGYQTDYTLNTRSISPNQEIEVQSKFYSGAKSVTLVDKYKEQYNIQGFDFLIDWGWFWFFTRPIFQGLLFFYSLVGNYGIAILLLTLVIKILFFPLANKSYTAMSRMKKLQPQMEKIKEKFSKDPMAQQQELIALYKKEKVNPVAGCWPMLLQIPVFFALYKVLNVALELRHQPFFGWIHDLSAPDPTNIFTLFGLIPIDMPSFLHIGIWPLLMGITMWMQQRLNPAPTDPVQAKMMSLFPIIFTFILAPFSAGLVVYWTWNNILSVTQQAVIMKRLGVPVEFRLWSKKKDDKGSAS